MPDPNVDQNTAAFQGDSSVVLLLHREGIGPDRHMTSLLRHNSVDDVGTDFDHFARPIKC